MRKQWFRILVAVAFVAGVTAILPRTETAEYAYEVGSPWMESDLEAQFSFPIYKTPKELEAEKQQARESVPVVFLRSPGLRQAQREKIETYFEKLAPVYNRITLREDAQAVAAINEKLAELFPETKYVLLKDLRQSPYGLAQVQMLALAVFREVYEKGFVDEPVAEIKTEFISMRAASNTETVRPRTSVFDNASASQYIQQRIAPLKGAAAKLALKALDAHLRANYLRDEALYAAEIEAKLEQVSAYYEKVPKGREIVARGEIVTEETARVIESMSRERARQSGQRKSISAYKFLGQSLIVALLTALTLVFLFLNRSKRVFVRDRPFLLLFVVYFLITLLMVSVENIGAHLTTPYDINLFYLAPMCMGPIMLTVFFDARVGFYSNIVISIFAALVNQNSFELFFVQGVTGAFAAFSISQLRSRAQFFIAAVVALASYCLCYLGYQFYMKGSLQFVNYENLILFAMNVAFTLGAYPLIYLIERAFGITSNLTYVEFISGDHPLQKQLYKKARGTYEHSHNVAEYAEQLAKQLNANALEVRVGALFHDVGKMKNPKFFTENQNPDEPNPHDDLPPEESARIILEHVSYGAELAEQYRLPHDIILYITSHHGQTRVEFFYRKYLEAHPDRAEEADEKFRYKGPKPETLEQAIVMFADSVEAASRSLKNPSDKDLEELVEKIINGKINDDQLVTCGVTFRDITKIKRTLTQAVQQHFHGRIAYEGKKNNRAPAPA